MYSIFYISRTFWKKHKQPRDERLRNTIKIQTRKSNAKLYPSLWGCLMRRRLTSPAARSSWGKVVSRAMAGGLQQTPRNEIYVFSFFFRASQESEITPWALERRRCFTQGRETVLCGELIWFIWVLSYYREVICVKQWASGSLYLSDQRNKSVSWSQTELWRCRRSRQSRAKLYVKRGMTQ